MFSLIVVTYNGRHHLEGCLPAIVRQTFPAKLFEVILVDNASADDTTTWVREHFPQIRYLRSETNLGFAGGNNLGAAAARYSTLVLLNNDTIPDPQWLTEIARLSQRHPGCAIASKLVLASDPGVLNSTGLGLLRDGRGADRGYLQSDSGQYEAEELVFGGCAAALALPAPQQGEPLFDPHFFMYCEDLDEAWGAALRGRTTVYAPRAVVRHAVGGSSGGEASSRFWFHVERNRALCALKNGDPVLALGSALGLVLRAFRAKVGSWLGLKHPKYRREAAEAVVRAVGSYFRLLPHALRERRLRREGPRV